ncbi:hypothetical protein ACMA5I_05610 [Paracoccaceae bacterium GXU_MW_L88]
MMRRTALLCLMLLAGCGAAWIENRAPDDHISNVNFDFVNRAMREATVRSGMDRHANEILITTRALAASQPELCLTGPDYIACSAMKPVNILNGRRAFAGLQAVGIVEFATGERCSLEARFDNDENSNRSFEYARVWLSRSLPPDIVGERSKSKRREIRERDFKASFSTAYLAQICNRLRG